MYRLSATRIGVVAAATLLVGAQSHADFIPLGNLPGGGFNSQALGISADGAVVVGDSDYNAPINPSQPFRWTQSTGMVGLGFLPGDNNGRALSVSADGSVVVGFSGGLGPIQAFRWTQATGIVGLGYLPGSPAPFSEALGVSGNGSVVVGNGPFGVAFRWTQATGMMPIGGGAAEAFAVSADGSVVVGSTASDEAYHWSQATGTVGLGFLPGGNVSNVFAVSANGSVIVGLSNSSVGGITYNAVRWTQATGMVSLGDSPLPGLTDLALGVSGDGSIIVGSYYNSATSNGAFIWNPTNGLRNLQDVLSTQGDCLSGWKLTEADAISTDGLTIVGIGKNPQGKEEAWLARLGINPAASVPEPSSLALLAVGGVALAGWRRWKKRQQRSQVTAYVPRVLSRSDARPG